MSKRISVFKTDLFRNVAKKCITMSDSDLDDFMDNMSPFDNLPVPIAVKMIADLFEKAGLKGDEESISMIVNLCSEEVDESEYAEKTFPEIAKKLKESKAISDNIGFMEEMDGKLIVANIVKEGPYIGRSGGDVGKKTSLFDSNGNLLHVGDFCMVMLNGAPDEENSANGLFYVPVLDLAGDGEGTLLGFGMKKDILKRTDSKQMFIKKVVPFSDIKDDYVMEINKFRIEYHAGKPKGALA